MPSELMAMRVAIPDHALARSLPDGESVIMNLRTEVYHGLNSSATQIWSALVTHGNVAQAYDELRRSLDVEPEQLAHDLEALVRELVQLELLQLRD